MGAASELYAASWFLGQGYAVYFPAIQQSVCDFIVAREGEYRSVQVKTATRTRTGGQGYVQCRTRLTNKYQHHTPADIADLWAVVYRTSLWIIPGEDIDTSNLCLRTDRGLTTARHRRWEQYRVLD